MPSTYDRGTTCINFIGISSTLPSTAIKRAGFLPFYHPFATDHRGLFLDLHIKTIFGKITVDTTKHIYRQFNTSNTKRCDKYIKKLEEYFLEHSKLFQKTANLQQKFMEFLDDPATHDGMTSSTNANVSNHIDRNI